jgi:hypothetical protein
VSQVRTDSVRSNVKTRRRPGRLPTMYEAQFTWFHTVNQGQARFVYRCTDLDQAKERLDRELTRRYGEAKREGRRRDASFLSFCGDTLRIELPRFRRLSESEARAEMTTPVQDMAVAS